MASQQSPVHAHFLPAVSREAMSFALSSYVADDVKAFVAGIPAGWGLGQLSENVKALTAELVAWIAANAPTDAFTVVLTWDKPILHVEVSDRGGIAPEPTLSRADAEFAVRLLSLPVVEWGADLDSRGRCLWATLRGDRDGVGSGSAESAAS
jgi:hypothetical protein